MNRRIGFWALAAITVAFGASAQVLSPQKGAKPVKGARYAALTGSASQGIDSGLAAKLPGKAERVTVVTVAVYPDTISPQEETVSGRRFRIRLVNYVGVGSMTFSLKKDAGAQLRQIRLTSERVKKSDEMTLEPGTYILEVAGMTKWTCRLHVRPPSK